MEQVILTIANPEPLEPTCPNSHHEVLSEFFQKFYQMDRYMDAIVDCGGRRFNAHRIVLAAYSSTLENAFNQLNAWAGMESVLVNLDSLNISDYAFEVLLSFMYTGKMERHLMENEEIKAAVNSLGIKQFDKFVAHVESLDQENLRSVITESMVDHTQFKTEPDKDNNQLITTFMVQSNEDDDENNDGKVEVYQEPLQLQDVIEQQQQQQELEAQPEQQHIQVVEQEPAEQETGKEELLTYIIQPGADIPGLPNGEGRPAVAPMPIDTDPSMLIRTIVDRLWTSMRAIGENGSQVTRYQCMLCPTLVEVPVDMVTHLHEEHECADTFPSCELCGEMFYVQGTYNKHRRSVHKIIETKKPDRLDKKAGEKYMIDHEGTVNPHECKICGLRFRHKMQCTLHVLHHIDESEFTCGSCSKSFVYQEECAEHMSNCAAMKSLMTPKGAGRGRPRKSLEADASFKIIPVVRRKSCRVAPKTPKGEEWSQKKAKGSPNKSLDKDKNNSMTKGTEDENEANTPRKRGRPRKYAEVEPGKIQNLLNASIAASGEEGQTSNANEKNGEDKKGDLLQLLGLGKNDKGDEDTGAGDAPSADTTEENADGSNDGNMMTEADKDADEEVIGDEGSVLNRGTGIDEEDDGTCGPDDADYGTEEGGLDQSQEDGKDGEEVNENEIGKGKRGRPRIIIKQERDSSIPKKRKTTDKDYPYSQSIRKLMDGSERYECKLCFKSYTLLSNIRRHLREHMDRKFQKSLPCNHCGKAFMRPYDLKKHISRHGPNLKTFQCPYCPCAYREKRSLDIHLPSHTESGCTCKTCGKAFTNLATLAVHEKSHGDRVMAVCNICGQTFTTQYLLDGHINRHNNVRPHVCKTCGKAYYTRAALYLHMREKHSAQASAMTTCLLCGKTMRERAYKRHRKTKHPEIIIQHI